MMSSTRALSASLPVVNAQVLVPEVPTVVTQRFGGYLCIRHGDQLLWLWHALWQRTLDERTVVHPMEIQIPLVNPYCGWGICAGMTLSAEFRPKGMP